MSLRSIWKAVQDLVQIRNDEHYLTKVNPEERITEIINAGAAYANADKSDSKSSLLNGIGQLLEDAKKGISPLEWLNHLGGKHNALNGVHIDWETIEQRIANMSDKECFDLITEQHKQQHMRIQPETEAEPLTPAA